MEHIITSFKIFENNNDTELYVQLVANNELEFYYDKIKEMGVEAKFFKEYGEERVLIYVYLTKEQKKDNFSGWHYIGNSTISNTYTPFDPEEYLKELKALKNATKYNL